MDCPVAAVNSNSNTIISPRNCIAIPFTYSVGSGQFPFRAQHIPKPIATASAHSRRSWAASAPRTFAAATFPPLASSKTTRESFINAIKQALSGFNFGRHSSPPPCLFWRNLFKKPKASPVRQIRTIARSWNRPYCCIFFSNLHSNSRQIKCEFQISQIRLSFKK